MGWWHDRVVPRMVEVCLGTEQVAELRDRAVAGLAGDVVEIGFGSGLNVRHYPRDVRSVAAVEPSDLAWELARPRIGAAAVPVRRAGLDGERLDLSDGSVDAALSTFTMCTIPDLDRALSELARVLRPDGRLHFLEHGRADDSRVARWQDRIQPVWGPIAGGCHVDRPIAASLARSPLEVLSIDTFYDEGPKAFGFLSLGVARSRP